MYKILLILISSVFSCSVVMMDNSVINKSKVYIEFSRRVGYDLTHIYFENINNRALSFGKNLESEDSCIEVYPGEYNVVCYGFDRLDTGKLLLSEYCITDKKIKYHTDDLIFLEMNKLSPKLFLSKYENGIYKLSININGVQNIVKMSSLSIKKPNEAKKALKYSFDSDIFSYYAFFEDNDVENTALNYSFSLKNRYDALELLGEETAVSTIAYTNIPLSGIELRGE
ncbi:MAG TPA: hypothetical protein PK385_06155 [Spirochaetota bacterium]|nr:hypothetical protein [Spirochaetota bacterium]HOS32376.1 hypothetical protein [Spirochaetota bacterium]HOS55623.1 hypothetical protein [Spirochaetota bacterium]HPK61668.1 hypothetical protein [Spirochaetota bacterium]HQF78139.1 hypothetical protein [Spirochaetota bacterium]